MKYQEQANIPSDKIVDAFKHAERLKINKKDMLDNLELFIENDKNNQTFTIEKCSVAQIIEN